MKISIILSTYNGKSNGLSQSIESVLGQSYKDFEFIVINDASTNDVERIILEYANKDKRIKYIKNDTNIGLTKSLNKGIKQAQGKYIARIDDDDIWSDPDKLQKQIDFMEAHSDYGICGTSVITINQSGQEIGRSQQRKSDEEIRNHILQSNQFAHASVCIRKSVLDEIGYYDERYKYAQDYELRCRIGRKYKLYNLPDYATTIGIDSQSISHKKYRYQQRLAFKVYWNNRKYYPHSYKICIARIAKLILPKRCTAYIVRLMKK